MFQDIELFRKQSCNEKDIPRPRLETYYRRYTHMLEQLKPVRASLSVQEAALDKVVAELSFLHTDHTGVMLPGSPVAAGHEPPKDFEQLKQSYAGLLDGHTVILNRLRVVYDELEANKELLGILFEQQKDLVVDVPVTEPINSAEAAERAKQIGLTVAGPPSEKKE